MRPRSRGCVSVCHDQPGIDARLNASDANEMSNWRAKYNAYMRSEEWQRMREYIFELRDGICEFCGDPATEIHHRTYERLGRELPIDLQALCKECHIEADIERAVIGIKKRMKKYAERWGEDREAEEEAFERWIQAQEREHTS
jgi:5-methylcytosine-specific restriction endonuclease McrA